MNNTTYLLIPPGVCQSDKNILATRAKTLEIDYILALTTKILQVH